MRPFVFERKPGAQAGSQTFIDEINATATRIMHCVAHRTLRSEFRTSDFWKGDGLTFRNPGKGRAANDPPKKSASFVA